MMIFFVVVFLRSIAEIQRCEQYKYICLKERYQNFNEKHKHNEERCTYSNAISGSRIASSEEKHKTHQSENYDVTGRDVRSQTNHQYSRFDEDTGDFDRNQKSTSRRKELPEARKCDPSSGHFH
jgi:hypothetical protein